MFTYLIVLLGVWFMMLIDLAKMIWRYLSTIGVATVLLVIGFGAWIMGFICTPWHVYKELRKLKEAVE